MLLSTSSSVTSPGPMILMPALSRPRSRNCLTKGPPGLAEAALKKLLHDGRPLPGRHEHENGVRLGDARALQHRREIGIGERKADRLEDLPSRLDEGILERAFRVDARR